MTFAAGQQRRVSGNAMEVKHLVSRLRACSIDLMGEGAE